MSNVFQCLWHISCRMLPFLNALIMTWHPVTRDFCVFWTIEYSELWILWHLRPIKIAMVNPKLLGNGCLVARQPTVASRVSSDCCTILTVWRHFVELRKTRKDYLEEKKQINRLSKDVIELSFIYYHDSFDFVDKQRDERLEGTVAMPKLC